MTAHVITVGVGKYENRGTRLELNSGNPAQALLDYFATVTPDYVEAWWSPATFRSDVRKAELGESWSGIGVDADYFDADGKHGQATPPDADILVMERGVMEGEAPGNAWHPTPHGARFLLLLEAPTSDVALWKRAARGAHRMVEDWLRQVVVMSETMPTGEKTAGFEIDDAGTEPQRIFWTPSTTDDKGLRRDFRTLLARETLYSVEELAALVPEEPERKRAEPLPGRIRHPGRHNALRSVAGTLRGRGLCEGQLFPMLWAFNVETCDPPYDEAHVRAIARAYAKRAGGTFQVKAAEEWPALEPLDAPVALPTFPLLAFPTTLRIFIAATAEELQVPTGLVGPLVLGTFSAALNRRVRIEKDPGWTEPVNIYTTAVMRTGTGKSPAFSAVKAPLKRIEERLREEAAEEIAEAASEHRTLEKQLDLAEKELATLRQKRSTSTEGQLKEAAERKRELARALKRHVVPAEPRLIAEDATVEKLAAMLAEQKERLAVFSSEAEPFSLAIRYAKDQNYNIDLYLKAWSNESFTADRKNGPPINLKRPSLVIAVTMQPTVLAALAKSTTGLRDRGLLGRFLWSIPPDLLGHRNMRPASMDAALRNRYDRAVREALGLHFPTASTDEHGEGVLTLTDEARELYTQFTEWLEPGNELFGRYAHMTDLTSKLRSNVLRLAGILHCMAFVTDSPGGDIPTAISAATMSGAINLAHYFLQHGEAVYREAGADRKLALAVRIEQWHQSERLERFSRRDAQRKVLGSQADEDGVLDAALDLLEEKGRTREQAKPERRKRGAPSTVYDVRPELVGVTAANGGGADA